jgi:hypothetical protein
MGNRKPHQRKAKIPKVGAIPPGGKVPKLPVKTGDRYVAWRFGMVDFNGPWCWTRMSADKQTEIYRKLSNFEKKAWTEFEGKGGNKNIPLSNLCVAAKKRLNSLKLDDADGSLYELRTAGKERVWAIRQGDILHLLWWDPEHEVCPSKGANN